MRPRPLLATLAALLVAGAAHARRPPPPPSATPTVTAAPAAAPTSAPAAAIPTPAPAAADAAADADPPPDDDPPAEEADEEPAAVPPAEDPKKFTYTLLPKSVDNGYVGRATFTVAQSPPVPNVGFAAVRVTIANGPLRQEAVVSFTLQETGRTVSRKVDLAPGERRAVVLPIPVANYGALYVRTAEGLSDGMRVYFNPMRGRTILLLGPSGVAADVFGPQVSASSRHMAKAQVAALAPEQLSGELAELAGYDAVILAGARLEDLSQAQARALEAYAATGGQLTLLKSGAGTAARLPALADAREGSHPYGFGRVRLCNHRKSDCAHAVGGEVLAHAPLVRPAGGNTRSYAYASEYGPSRAKLFLLPQASPPVGRFLIILTVFCLAIGPGSVLVARRRSPSMLLFTVPATALVTCLLIVGYSLVVDGFATHAHGMSFSLLDRRHDRVVTVGNAALYANLSPGTARFGAGTAVLFPWGDKQGATVDWTEGATFSRDLLPPRTYRELGLLSVDASRARLVVKREGGAVRVQNALGAPIRWGLVRAGGGIFELQGLGDGAEAQAQPVKGALPTWQHDAEEDLTRFNDEVVQQFTAPLADREFVAVLDGPGALPLGGLSAQHHGSQHLIRGEVE